jgi:hypothetical protein
MNKQSNEVKWIPANLLFGKIQRTEKRYGDYSILVLTNGSNIVIDNKNSKSLVLANNRPYVVAKDFEKWLDRGFIVVTLLHKRLADGSYYQAKHSHNDKHYVLNAKDGSVVCVGYMFDSDVEKFLAGDSDYFILQNIQRKFAIFHKNGQQITDWFDYIYLEGLVESVSDYYIVQKNNKEAIFHKNGKQITDWYNRIDPDGLVNGESDYYIAKKVNKYAIFHKSGKQISHWFDDIRPTGLVRGESDYYLAENNRKYAIFHKDGRQISDWYKWFSVEGLTTGETEYYIAGKNRKYAIFDKNGKQITNWYDVIYADGLVVGRSNYYIVKKNKKETIFNKDGQQIIDWFDYVYPDGLVRGQSDYYVVKKHQKVYIGKLGSPKLLGPFQDSVFWDQAGVISDPASDSIAVRTLDSKVLNISKTDIEKFFEDKEVEDGRAK